MKSMLSDLDFSNVKFEPGDKTKLLTGGTQAAIELIRRHNDNLVRALEAALRLCEAYRLEHNEAVRNYWQEKRTKELETALEPFRKEQK